MLTKYLKNRHLTFVEHSLERATAEIGVLRRRIRTLENNDSTRSEPIMNASDTTRPSQLSSSESRDQTSGLHGDNSFQIPDREPLLDKNGYFATCETIEPEVDEHSNIQFEGPPTTTADFDWDERENPMDPEWLSVENSDEIAFVDGMASLSIHEHDTGYLGVASGAALLRIIKPAVSSNALKAPVQSPSRPEGQKNSSNLNIQPNSNIHILDAMIDGYFRTYHISYPTIHEPRFRAQYSEVIPKPKGNGWKALVYMIAAVGAFSSATSPGAADVALFNAARSQISMNDLESGNISLIQLLTLMSNYLQKRNKPNSGYNYLGLALRMAMGLGLHKEFPKWDISPLQMEIRRRVWWTLFVFDIGATITFSRPIGWPHEGIEVALPLNIHDRVGLQSADS
jgi:transcriptional regulatory protein GAL4